MSEKEEEYPAKDEVVESAAALNSLIRKIANDELQKLKTQLKAELKAEIIAELRSESKTI